MRLLFDFGEDIYGFDIKVDFLSRLRDEIHFDSFEQLRLQLEKDLRAVRCSH